jgi:hypothetical protein
MTQKELSLHLFTQEVRNQARHSQLAWAANGKGNRNPILVLNGDNGMAPISLEKKQNEEITYDASKSYDLENDKLSIKWWIQPEAETYQKEIVIDDKNSTGYRR